MITRKILYVLCFSLLILHTAPFSDDVYAEESSQLLSYKQIGANILASASVSENGAVVVTDNGKIYLSGDAGETWMPIESKTEGPLFDVCFVDAHKGWISGKDGLILYTCDGGRTWGKQENSTLKHLFAIDFADDTHGYAVGDWAGIVVTADGGKTWQDRSMDDDLILYGVAAFDASHACAVGEMGRIFLTEDAGMTWNELEAPVFSTLFCLDKDNDSLFAAGIDGEIICSADRGVSWKKAVRKDCPAGDIYALYDIAVKDGKGLAVGEAGKIMLTDDGGATWRKVNKAAKPFKLATVSVETAESGKLIGLTAGNRGVLARYADDNFIW